MRKIFCLITALAAVASIVTAVSCITRASAEPGNSSMASESLEDVMAVLDSRPAEHWLTHLESMPDNDCVKLRVNPPAGPLRKCFLDSNYLHFAAGQQYGIRPITCTDDIWQMNRPMVHVVSCAEYFVDSLSHSYPYLVPKAAALLSDIGQAFNDSLRSRGGGCYRLKVTSLLRTRRSISRLRRVNRVAVDSSSHSFGTTFDISYSNFICDAATVNRTAEDLKNLLAEIVHDFRSKGRCLAIYELSQACFHITCIDGDYRRPAPPEPKDEPRAKRRGLRHRR